MKPFVVEEGMMVEVFEHKQTFLRRTSPAHRGYVEKITNISDIDYVVLRCPLKNFKVDQEVTVRMDSHWFARARGPRNKTFGFPWEDRWENEKNLDVVMP